MIDVERLLKALGVKYKQRSQNELWACCPFKGHNEKTPSWSIHNKHGEKYGSHKCFGCGHYGGPVMLVMLNKNYNYAAAMDWIEERGLNEVLQFSFEVKVVKTRSREGALELPGETTGCGILAIWPKPLREKIEERGLGVVQVQRWGIGYTPRSAEIGGRFVMPMRDDTGRLRNFSARTYTDHRIKYRSGKLTDGADPGALFGPEHWPDMDQRNTVFVSEGGFNALANERVGAKYLAAVDGSELLPAHLAAIGTFDEIVLVTDPDEAGDKLAAAFDGMRRWREIRRVNLPEGYDSNKLEREDREHLKRLLMTDETPPTNHCEPTDHDDTVPF